MLGSRKGVHHYSGLPCKDPSHLITGTLIDICAHVFQTIGKTAAQTAAQMCLPFCSLLMKHKGVRPLKDGKIIVCHHPISIASLQKSKSHYSAERKKQDLSTTPKSESVQHVTHSGHGSAAHTTPGHIETTSPTFLSLRQLALSQHNLVLTPTSSLFWFKIYMSVF